MACGKKCDAFGCKKYQGSNHGLSYFRFPKEIERCRQWMINCGRNDLEIFFEKSPRYLADNCRLCADHFEDSQFTNRILKNRLIPSALPTLFHHSKSRAENPDQSIGRVGCLSTILHTIDKPTLSRTTVADFPSTDTNSISSTTTTAPLRSLVYIIKDEVSSCASRDLRGASSSVIDQDSVDHKYTTRTDYLIEIPSNSSSSLQNKQTLMSCSPTKDITMDPSSIEKKLSKESQMTKLINKQRVQLCRLRKKHRSLAQRYDELLNSVQANKNVLSNGKNDSKSVFQSSQLKFKNRNKFGRRYTVSDEDFALSLYACSPDAYRLCSKFFVLPTVRSLQKWIKKKTEKINSNKQNVVEQTDCDGGLDLGINYMENVNIDEGAAQILLNDTPTLVDINPLMVVNLTLLARNLPCSIRLCSKPTVPHPNMWGFGLWVHGSRVYFFSSLIKITQPKALVVPAWAADKNSFFDRINIGPIFSRIDNYRKVTNDVVNATGDGYLPYTVEKHLFNL